MIGGEKNAFPELIRRHHPNVLAVCRNLLLVPSQADDAAQDVFVNVYKRLASFRGDSAFPTWLYRIATNHCLDLLRKRKRERSESFEALLEQKKAALANLFLSSPGPETSLEQQDLVRHMLAALTETERNVLGLRETQGLSYREIASVLDCSVEAAKARLKRARQALLEKTRHLFRLENV